MFTCDNSISSTLDLHCFRSNWLHSLWRRPTNLQACMYRGVQHGSDAHIPAARMRCLPSGRGDSVQVGQRHRHELPWMVSTVTVVAMRRSGSRSHLCARHHERRPKGGRAHIVGALWECQGT